MREKIVLRLDVTEEEKGSGHYRYGLDLIRALVEARSPRFHFEVWGQTALLPEPLQVFQAQHPEGWDYYHLPTKGNLGLVTAGKVNWQLRRRGAALLHDLRNPSTCFSPCPHVLTFYDLMFELFPEYRTISRSREWKWYRWQCCRQVDRLLAISEQTAGDLRRLWRVPAERIRVVPLGLEPSSPAPRSQPTGPDFILSYFNLEPRKNLLGLVRAWKQVHQKHPQFSLRLFGRAGWSEQREKEFYLELDREGLRSSVTILGYVNDADLAVLYRQCALFVYPSFYEGFGLPIVEAMRQGACVLAHEADPMADLIGEAGAVTDFGSESLIAEKLDDLLRDGEQRRVLAEKARDRSLVFSWQNMARGTLEVYEELLGPVGSGVAR